MREVRMSEKMLEQLIAHYTNYVSAIVRRTSCGYLTVEDMEEVISDVFFSLWKSGTVFECMESVKPYLAQIARNTTKSRLRKQRREVEAEEEEALRFVSVDENCSEKEQVETVRNILKEMGRPDREILLLYYFYGFKLEEIAEELQLPLSTVKTKVYRGKKKIAERFEKEGN